LTIALVLLEKLYYDSIIQQGKGDYLEEKDRDLIEKFSTDLFKAYEGVFFPEPKQEIKPTDIVVPVDL